MNVKVGNEWVKCVNMEQVRMAVEENHKLKLMQVSDEPAVGIIDNAIDFITCTSHALYSGCLADISDRVMYTSPKSIVDSVYCLFDSNDNTNK